MYDRRIEGESFIFGNTSALYESDMVMVDHQTGSYWMQVSGEAIVGSLAGERLEALPSQTTTWALWRDQYPDSQVLSRETGYQRNYDFDPFTGLGEQLNASGRFIFPVSETGRDPRLPPGEIVLGVELEAQHRAYPLGFIGDGVVNDEMAQSPIVIFSLAEGPTGAAFLRTLDDGRELTFVYEGDVFKDRETGSTWNLAGEAIDGSLSGSQLKPLPTRSSFWFSLISSFPDLTLYMGDSTE